MDQSKPVSQMQQPRVILTKFRQNSKILNLSKDKDMKLVEMYYKVGFIL